MRHDFKYIEYRKRPDKIAEIILNRPEKLNAIHDDMRFEMLEALDDAERDDQVNVLIIKGNGKAFSSGHDLSRAGGYYGFETERRIDPNATTEKQRRPSQRTRLKRDRECLSRIYQDRFLFSWVPIIVQIHGYCIGGAMMLQLACDISIAADDALVGYTEQRMGFGGNAMDMGALTMAVGSKKAQLLLLTGAMLSGKEAAEMGLISKSVPPDRLEAEVEEAAQTIARMPRDGVAIGRAAKEMVYHSLGISGDRAIGYVSHTLFSNLRWEDDEFNFFKQRRESGTGDAIKSRNEFFGDT